MVCHASLRHMSHHMALHPPPSLAGSCFNEVGYLQEIGQEAGLVLQPVLAHRQSVDSDFNVFTDWEDRCLPAVPQYFVQNAHPTDGSGRL